MPISSHPLPFPNAASLAALRTWYVGVGSRDAVDRFLSRSALRREIGPRRDWSYPTATRGVCRQSSSRRSGETVSVRSGGANSSLQGSGTRHRRPAVASDATSPDQRPNRCVAAVPDRRRVACARHQDAGRPDSANSPSVMGIDLMPRMRNIKDLILYKADKRRKYEHIDSLCRQTIDWNPIERHYADMMRVAVPIQTGKMTPSTILRRLGSEA